MVMNGDFWRGRRVFLTGHTGFKGSWLSLWLQRMGAEVSGYSLSLPTTPSLFKEAALESVLADHTFGDIRDFQSLAAAVSASSPEIVLHLAAQPLVRHSYVDPIETYQTNVLGTVGMLEAVRNTPSVKAVVVVTTDKCYENREWDWGYREREALGGFDPYSSSKACTEIVTSAYRRSFLADQGIAVATARAGNVIGGGDFAGDRLLPDFFRALAAGQDLVIRSPGAIRPWQHVLEPLSGYLALAERLITDPADVPSAFNFGPADEDAKPVSWILDRLVALHPGTGWRLDDQPQPHEANYLKLDSSLARNRLGWSPRWSLPEALGMTSDWFSRWRAGENAAAIMANHIEAYEAAERRG